MPTKLTTEQVLTKHLGKEASQELLNKVDEMVAAGATSEKIEKAAYEHITASLDKLVTTAVIAKIGPIQPVKINSASKAVTVSVKTIQPISIEVRQPIMIKVPNVKVGPPIEIGPGPINTRGLKK